MSDAGKAVLISLGRFQLVREDFALPTLRLLRARIYLGDDYATQTLDRDDAARLRAALDTWLGDQPAEPQDAQYEVAPREAGAEQLQLQLRRQEEQVLQLREAMAQVPALIAQQVSQAIERTLTKVAPIMAEQSAAAMAALRPDGNTGYMGADGRWRPPLAVNYSDQPGPGAGLMGQPPPPRQRIEGPGPGVS